MKRKLSMFLALCMVMTLLPMTALAAPAEYGILADDDNIVTGTGYSYDTVTRELTITSNDGAKGSSEWRKKPDDIGDSIEIIKYVKSITVGNGVTQIGRNVFNDIPELTSVHLGAGVTSVAPVNFSVFLACPKLTSIEVHEDNTTYKGVDGVLFSKDGKKLIRYPDGK